jgi:hypothetical protein
MSKLLKTLYDVADIRCRYHRVHEAMFGFSARRLLRSMHPSASSGAATLAEELDRLTVRLAIARQELGDLDQADLAIRRGREIQGALISYIDALTESNARLRAICDGRHGVDTASATAENKLRTELKIAYDDAVQYHKRLGAQLNKLISTY